MDYQTLAIIVLAVMLIVSLAYNFILERKIERLRDADIIDDMTFDDEEDDYAEKSNCEILYL